MSRIPLVGLLPARNRGMNRTRIAQQHLMAQPGQQTSEPTVIPRCFQTDTNRLASQAAIEPNGILGMVQTPLSVFSTLLVYVRYLLEASMQITSYNQHIC